MPRVPSNQIPIPQTMLEPINVQAPIQAFGAGKLGGLQKVAAGLGNLSKMLAEREQKNNTLLQQNALAAITKQTDAYLRNPQTGLLLRKGVNAVNVSAIGEAGLNAIAQEGVKDLSPALQERTLKIVSDSRVRQANVNALRTVETGERTRTITADTAAIIASKRRANISQKLPDMFLSPEMNLTKGDKLDVIQTDIETVLDDSITQIDILRQQFGWTDAQFNEAVDKERRTIVFEMGKEIASRARDGSFSLDNYTLFLDATKHISTPEVETELRRFGTALEKEKKTALNAQMKTAVYTLQSEVLNPATGLTRLISLFGQVSGDPVMRKAYNSAMTMRREEFPTAPRALSSAYVFMTDPENSIADQHEYLLGLRGAKLINNKTWVSLEKEVGVQFTAEQRAREKEFMVRVGDLVGQIELQNTATVGGDTVILEIEDLGAAQLWYHTWIKQNPKASPREASAAMQEAIGGLENAANKYTWFSGALLNMTDTLRQNLKTAKDITLGVKTRKGSSTIAKPISNERFLDTEDKTIEQAGEAAKERVSQKKIAEERKAEEKAAKAEARMTQADRIKARNELNRKRQVARDVQERSTKEAQATLDAGRIATGGGFVSIPTEYQKKKPSRTKPKTPRRSRKK